MHAMASLPLEGCGTGAGKGSTLWKEQIICATNRQLGPLQWEENEQKFFLEPVFALRKVLRVLGRPNL